MLYIITLVILCIYILSYSYLFRTVSGVPCPWVSSFTHLLLPAPVVLCIRPPPPPPVVPHLIRSPFRPV
jgi:hypothetical protein